MIVIYSVFRAGVAGGIHCQLSHTKEGAGTETFRLI